MRKIFENNKSLIVITIGSLVIGGLIFLNLSKQKRGSIDNIPKKENVADCSIPSQVVVTKVIDGDTVVVEGGYHIRLLGIDADERGYPCYEDAKLRLEKLILNKKVKLEKDRTDVDQYGRCLRYIFFNNQDVNLELVKEGLAVARFYEPNDKYKSEIIEAEKKAIDNGIGCKWSSSSKKILESRENKEDSEIDNLRWKKLTTSHLGVGLVKACQAKNYLGENAIVEGRIVDTYRTSKSDTVFLNFEKVYPNQCFTGVIFGSDLYKFSEKPEDYYLNKYIRVAGKIKEYQGRPEIILKDPNQIEVGK